MIRATFRPAVMVLATILFFLKCKKTIFLKNLSFFWGGGQSPNFHFFWKTNARICLVTTYYIKKVLAPWIWDQGCKNAGNRGNRDPGRSEILQEVWGCEMEKDHQSIFVSQIYSLYMIIIIQIADNYYISFHTH